MSQPTTEFGFSYEYGVDIKTSESTWTPIRFISAVNPAVTAVTQEAATYDDHGAPNPVKTSESWTLGFTIQQHRIDGDADGKFLPEVEALLALQNPDAVGELATGQFRWYDKPVSGTPNKAEAYEGIGTVEITRQETGNNGIGGWSVTITGRGRRTKITNPYTPPAAP